MSSGFSFAPTKAAIATRDNDYASLDDADTLNAETDTAVKEIVIEGAPIAHGAVAGFLQGKRHVGVISHPYLDNQLAFITSTAKDHAPFVRDEARVFRFHSKGDERGLAVEEQVDLANDCLACLDELAFRYNDDPELDPLDLARTACEGYREAYDLAGRRIAEREEIIEQDELDALSYREMHGVLSCLDAVYLAPRETSLSDALMDWVNRSDPRPTAEEGEEIMLSRQPYLHPSFWDYVYKGIIRGLFDMVRKCLESSGLAQIDMPTAQATRDLCLMLSSCPRANSYVGNVGQFSSQYKRWRQKLVQLSKTLSLPDSDNDLCFRQAYELLRGDREAVFRHAETWQEALAALALLFDPTGCKAAKDVRALYDIAVNPEESELNVDTTLASEAACAALCAANGPNAVKNVVQVDELGAAMLADLLEKVEVLEDVRSADLELSLRELLLLRAGDKLIGLPAAWKSAVLLWKHVPVHGTDRVALTLPRVAFSSQEEVDYALALCDTLDMDDAAIQIETVWGRKLEAQHHHYRAALAYDRADQAAMIDQLNWTLFSHTLLQGRPASVDPELVAALDSPAELPSASLSVLLAPYATLSAYYRCKDSEEPREAARHLAALMKFPDLPKRYMALLLAESLPLLGAPVSGALGSGIHAAKVAFGHRDLFDCLAAIEDFYSTAPDLSAALQTQAMDTELRARADGEDDDKFAWMEAMALLRKAITKPRTSQSTPDSMDDAGTSLASKCSWRDCIYQGAVSHDLFVQKTSPEKVLQLVRLWLARALARGFISGDDS
ncbi:hypothetical protein PYCC9005_004012 [Savitreella phatthalungensis]